jgi:hypothetical protein
MQTTLKHMMRNSVQVREEMIAKLGYGGGGARGGYPEWFYDHCDRIEAKIQELRAEVQAFRRRVEQEPE